MVALLVVLLCRSHDSDGSVVHAQLGSEAVLSRAQAPGEALELCKSLDPGPDLNFALVCFP